MRPILPLIFLIYVIPVWAQDWTEDMSEAPDEYDRVAGASGRKTAICDKDRKALEDLINQILGVTGTPPNCRSPQGLALPQKKANDLYSQIMGTTALAIDDVLVKVARERAAKAKTDPKFASELKAKGLKIDPRFDRNCMAGVKYAMCGDPSQATNIDDSKNRSRKCHLDMTGTDDWPPGASALESMRFLRKSPYWKEISCGGCVSPSAAPDNSIICYEPMMSASEFKKLSQKTDSTAKYGHCEIKTRTEDGRVKYCYDGCGNTPRTTNPHWAQNPGRNRKVAAIFVRAESGVEMDCAKFTLGTR